MVVKRLRAFSYWRKNKALLALLLGVVLIISIAGYAVVLELLSVSSAHIGANVDMSAIIPGTPYTITTAHSGNFFDLAEQLGINTLRITDIQWELSGEEYSQATWRHVFDEAAQHHINIILLLIDGKGHPAIEQAHTLLERYRLAYASALWLVDLYNEPDLSDPQRMNALHKEAAYVHSVAPGVPVTIGGWRSEMPGNPGEFDWQDPADIPKFISLVDVVSPHLYQFAEAAQQGFTPQQWTRRFLNAVRQKAQQKPILLEEFGASNGLAPTTTSNPTGSPEWQAFVYHGVLQEIVAEYHHHEVIGAVAWISAPRTLQPDQQGDMSGWAFILNNGHRLLPAAKAFSTPS
ncbi:MAG: cellulase family glycosylhydrolase [Ktedonobacteraceae bacterium]|nr:cellulase family glycosylhydrolase [Ktedonobacteraceae bacterium]